jgi:hypothetical protein
MTALFSKPKFPDPPPLPKVQRMPTPTDPEIDAAAKRQRMGALTRGGRLSTILSDSLQSVAGSSGAKLGA